MSEGAGHSGWRRLVDGGLTALQRQDGGLRQFAVLWATVVSVVLIACAAFFLAIYWIFG